MIKSRHQAKTVGTFDTLEGRALLTVSAMGYHHYHPIAAQTSTNPAFVDQLFTVALNRSSGETELTDITGRLDSGKLTRVKLARGVLNSQESLTILVNDTYQTVLGNAPTPSQLQSGIAYLSRRGGSLNGLSARIYGTPEYRTTSSITDNTMFVANVASDAGVVLTTAQTNTYVDQLDSGRATSTKVALKILRSHEALGHQIDSLYTSYLGTSPTGAQQTSAFATIKHAHRYGLRLALINSNEFVPA